MGASPSSAQDASATEQAPRSASRSVPRLPCLYPTDTATPSQRHGMAMLWWNTILSAVSGSFYGDFVNLFLLALGASAASIGVRTSINSAAALMAPLIGAWLVERTRQRKRWVLLGGIVVRVTLLLLALVPLFFQGNAAVAVFVALLALQSFAGSVGGPAGNSLLGDILPLAVRGRYLGAQMMISNVVRVAIVPLAGWLIRGIGGIQGYQAAWVLGALTGFWANWYFARIPEPPTIEGQALPGAHRGFIEGWRVLAQDRRFVFFCGINFIWNLGVATAGTFFQVHMVEHLGFKVDTIALLATVTTLVNILALRAAGELVDRYGAPRMTSVAMFLVPFLPLLWIPARTPLHVGLVQCYGQIAWASFHVSATPLILMLTPPQQRSRYIAIYNTTNGLAAILGPLLASYSYTHWGFTTNLILSAVGRGLGGVLFFVLLKTGGFRRTYAEQESAA